MIRQHIDLIESAMTPISPELSEQILGDRRCHRGVKVSEKTRLWRGQDEGSEGSGFATYGLGFYFTADKSYAAKYGKVSEVSRTMLPDNGLRFDTINDFQIWHQQAAKLLGYTDMRDFSTDYPDFGDFIRALDPSIDGLQIMPGKYAIFVTWDA